MHFAHIEARDEPSFVEKAVAAIAQHLGRAAQRESRGSIGLSGGSTPRPIYEALGKRNDIPWKDVHLFLVDERYVPETHNESTGGMVREVLLRHVQIPEENIVFPDTRLPLEECTEHYAQSLQKLWKHYPPTLAILGMGDDGHIASLFPPLPKNDRAKNHLAISTKAPTEPRKRVSLTLPSILAASHHLFLLKGERKRRTWDAMLQSTEGEDRWPAKAILLRGRATIVTLW